jgi:pimeloyl-ACP methyl ester carboxylesterase
MKKIILLLLCILGATTIYAQNIAGQWNGVLEIQGMKLRITFHIEQIASVYKATMDSPDQGVKGIPVTFIRFKDSNLKMEVENIGFSYTGIQKNDTLIEGSFSQGGIDFPLNLIIGEAKLKRPQEPKPPFSYKVEEIKFENKQEGFSLAGTLTYPQEGSNFPAVILVTGSGPQNRDEELFEHKPFFVLADYLTRQGIAVLRYDDRSVGGSGGDLSSATTKDLALDALSGFNYLKTRKEINPRKIGLLGHSEGGMITFMLAAENKDIAFIVSMAGTAMRGDSLLYEQRKMISSAAGVPPAAFEQNEELVRKLNDIISTHSIDEIKQNASKYVDELFPVGLTPEQKKGYEQQIIGQASPWMQYFMKYNPADDIPKIKCPIFAINGMKDVQVNADTNLDRVKALSPKATVKKYPDLNHLFQHCKTGLMNEYGEIEETISPEVLNDIAVWINSVTK